MTDNMSTADESQQRHPTIKSLMKEVEELRERFNSSGGGDTVAISRQLLEIQEENVDLKERVRKQEMELKAIRVQAMNSEERLQHAQTILARLERERAHGGANKWRILNARFKDRSGKPASHVIYSDATSATEAVQDFKRRAGVQWDSTEGSDPFSAELVEIAGKS